MLRAFTNLLQALATGYILFFFSERLFWTVWWPGTRLPEVILTWLIYSTIAYLFLAVVSWSRAADFWSVFLAGAAYGWLVEGALANTLYGTQPSAPFPASISITGLSWHALISVMLGWWATEKALTANRPKMLICVLAGVGLLWGMWAMFPRRETPPIQTSAGEFFANAALLTLGLAMAWWLRFRAGPFEFRPGALGLVLCAVPPGLFYLEQVRALGIRPLAILPVVLTAALVPLYRHRRCPFHGADVPAIDFRPGRLVVFLILPIVATLVYAGAVALKADRSAIIPLAVYSITGLGGALLFVVAVGVAWFRCRAG
jgi:hypothetical protein